MYKHMANSIKETDERMFLSQTDIDKYNNYEEVLMDKDNSYSKEEMEVVINEANKHFITFEGEMSNIKGSSTGEIRDIEVFGNTTQRVEEIVLTPEMEAGGINTNTGEIVDGDYLRTKEFIPVLYNDKIEYFNRDIPANMNVIFYNNDGNFIKAEYCNGVVNIPFGCKYIKIFHYVIQDIRISMKITRTHLNDIRSVCEKLGDNRYELELVSCGKNLFNGELITGDIDVNNGSAVPDTLTHVIPKDFIQVESDTNYNIHFKDIAEYHKWFSVFLYDSNFNLISCINTNGEDVNFNTTKYTKYIKFKIENPANVTVKVQLEKGEKSDYEPYRI